jgi:mono-ADP-ribosyltransferase sirtuin 6
MEPNYSPPTLKNPHQSHIILLSEIKKNFQIINGSYSNDFILIEKCYEFTVSIKENQILRSILLLNNEKINLSILDSAVVYSRIIRIINCKDSYISIVDADIRRIELWDCKNVTITIMCEQVQFENINIIIHSNNDDIKICYSEIIRDYINLDFRNEILNKINIPKITDNDKIILVQCVKIPLFLVNIFNINDIYFQEKLSWIKYMTKTLEFQTEELNKKLNEIVSSNEIIEAINELKKIPYSLKKEDIIAQYDKEKLEYIEPNSILLPKIKEIAKLLKNSKHCIVFTGAGVSTSANIPDFRGPEGIWTKEHKNSKINYGSEINEIKPTYCHYALTELARKCYIKFLITTNMDGLHWRSGFPEHMIEELHGSAYTEHCPFCHNHYRRLKEVERGSPDHLTGNKCDFCGNKLMDTIVNFNDNYRNPLEGSIVDFHSNEADLVIVLGSSCFVQPAATYPEKVVLSEKSNLMKKLNKEGKLVLVNLQATPLDEYCSIRCFCKTDDFAKLLMKELGLENLNTNFDAKHLNKIEESNKCIIY